ncbi:MAG: ATP-binding protein [Candidatus Omnitrophica bacterium]|nr:ATP-binding protein [Candidatus Omnitrophota bacterium]MBU1784835.1 ATP-binding protein [Candidatus Omnitrophota bacterium]MBU1850999.1 ATP-binding protein [Candidatus Omnitrophota bacterium]
MYRESGFIWGVKPGSRHDRILERLRARGVLLDSGRYAVPERLKKEVNPENDLLLVRICCHEDFEVLMQKEEQKMLRAKHPRRTRYHRLREQILNNEEILRAYYAQLPDNQKDSIARFPSTESLLSALLSATITRFNLKNKKNRTKEEQAKSILFNDVIACAFELRFIINEHVVYPNTDLSVEEREFIKLMRPILEAKNSRGRYKNFLQVFFDIEKRTKLVRGLQEDKDERFYRVASNTNSDDEGQGGRSISDPPDIPVVSLLESGKVNVNEDDIPFTIIDAILRDMPPTEENEVGDKWWKDIAYFEAPDYQEKKIMWLNIGIGGPKSLKEHSYTMYTKIPPSAFSIEDIELEKGKTFKDYNDYQQELFMKFLCEIKNAFFHREEIKKIVKDKKEQEEKDIAEIIPRYTKWSRQEKDQRKQNMKALIEANQDIKGLPRDKVSLKLFFEVLTFVYRVLAYKWENKTITSFDDISRSRYSNKILQKKNLLRYKKDYYRLEDIQKEANKAYIDMDGYQKMGGNSIEFLRGHTIHFVNDPTDPGRIRISVEGRNEDSTFNFIDGHFTLYETLVNHGIPVEFHKNFSKLYLGEYNIKYFRDQNKYPLFAPSFDTNQSLIIDVQKAKKIASGHEGQGGRAIPIPPDILGGMNHRQKIELVKKLIVKGDIDGIVRMRGITIDIIEKAKEELGDKLNERGREIVEEAKMVLEIGEKLSPLAQAIWYRLEKPIWYASFWPETREEICQAGEAQSPIIFDKRLHQINWDCLWLSSGLNKDMVIDTQSGLKLKDLMKDPYLSDEENKKISREVKKILDSISLTPKMQNVVERLADNAWQMLFETEEYLLKHRVKGVDSSHLNDLADLIGGLTLPKAVGGQKGDKYYSQRETNRKKSDLYYLIKNNKPEDAISLAKEFLADEEAAALFVLSELMMSNDEEIINRVRDLSGELRIRTKLYNLVPEYERVLLAIRIMHHKDELFDIRAEFEYPFTLIGYFIGRSKKKGLDKEIIRSLESFYDKTGNPFRRIKALHHRVKYHTGSVKDWRKSLEEIKKEFADCKDEFNRICNKYAAEFNEIPSFKELLRASSKDDLRPFPEAVDYYFQKAIDFLGSLVTFANGKVEDIKGEVDIIALVKKRGTSVKIDPSGLLQLNIPANPQLLESAVANLIRNAYASGAEKVNIKLEYNPEDTYVRIQVIDNGPGIPEEGLKPSSIDPSRERIYDIGWSTRASTGLGLPWIRHIIRLHGGAIEIKSKGDEGTTFTIKLPVGEETVYKTAQVREAFSALNGEARKVSQLNSHISGLRGTSQDLMEVTKFRFCVPINVLKNSPDITHALNTTGLLKQKVKGSENIEFELVVTGVTDEDVDLIDGLNRDDIRKALNLPVREALNLPEKFNVSRITERQMQETAGRFGYDISNAKDRVAIVKDFFSGALTDGEYMAIATDAVKTEDDADRLQAEIEREFKQELSRENISVRVLVGPEQGTSMFSLSKILNDWFEAISKGNLSSISKIPPVPAPLTPELERAIKEAWAVLTAA